jgi:hypothetical protein
LASTTFIAYSLGSGGPSQGEKAGVCWMPRLGGA